MTSASPIRNGDLSTGRTSYAARLLPRAVAALAQRDQAGARRPVRVPRVIARTASRVAWRWPSPAVRRAWPRSSARSAADVQRERHPQLPVYLAKEQRARGRSVSAVERREPDERELVVGIFGTDCDFRSAVHVVEHGLRAGLSHRENGANFGR
jgi:hypothetical protein